MAATSSRWQTTVFPVTKPRLPDLGRYIGYLEQAHARNWLTNFGPLHEELTARLQDYLGVSNLLLVANGTLALQVAYRALEVTGQALTTPFSFIATTATLAWEGIAPVFIDIDPDTLNLDPRALASSSVQASAVVAVHVYGNPCDVEAIEAFGAARSIPVIYDAAHAFGSTYDGRSALAWGDAATLSFHATKIFHTIEGGAIVFRDRRHLQRARELVNFGIKSDGATEGLGINAKLSEYHAAAGLVLLDGIDEVLARRIELVETYRRGLDGWVQFQRWNARGRNNGSYMPILLDNEEQCLSLHNALAQEGIGTRRYFHPSLNTVASSAGASACPVSERSASRVLCLPLYAGLAVGDAVWIGERVKAHLCQAQR